MKKPAAPPWNEATILGFVRQEMAKERTVKERHIVLTENAAIQIEALALIVIVLGQSGRSPMVGKLGICNHCHAVAEAIR